MGFNVTFDVRHRDIQGHTVLLQKTVNFVARLETHEPTHLTLVQYTGSVRLNRDRLDRVAGCSLAPGQRLDLGGHAAALVDAFVDRRGIVDAGVNARHGRLVHRVGQARERARREAIGVVRVVGVADVAPECDQRVDRGAGLARVRRRVLGNGGVGRNVVHAGSM